MPVFYLTWVKPYICKGTYVLCNPYEQCGQDDSHNERHTSLLFIHLEIDSCFKEKDDRVSKQNVSDIENKMMSKEIYIDENCKNP